MGGGFQTILVFRDYNNASTIVLFTKKYLGAEGSESLESLS